MRTRTSSVPSATASRKRPSRLRRRANSISSTISPRIASCPPSASYAARDTRRYCPFARARSEFGSLISASVPPAKTIICKIAGRIAASARLPRSCPVMIESASAPRARTKASVDADACGAWRLSASVKSSHSPRACFAPCAHGPRFPNPALGQRFAGDDPQCGTFRREPLEDCSRAIGRAVVDDDDLHVAAELSDEGTNARLDAALLIAPERRSRATADRPAPGPPESEPSPRGRASSAARRAARSPRRHA